ncbi:hypothetical protein [Streptomyces echinatus]|uniref:Uncharacterized protein n=1 Tax=Streptomyces echinatus TaxID=67293 RepID=A0A7W9Q3L9_9ACTN|nr:hypothetical protein [Streptomyces echinatus]MBB5932724.1 hypothetical protein [Streptomyces echinatus]
MAYYAPPRPAVSWPHQVGVLARQAECFQDRATATLLEQTADSGGTVVPGQVLAGLGGVGKTQLAAHHARTLWQTGQLGLLVWITAATRDAVVTGYAQAAVEVLGAGPTDPEPAARAFLAWLEPKAMEPEHGTARRWLIVLDDLADLRGLWPPPAWSPHAVATPVSPDTAVD